MPQETKLSDSGLSASQIQLNGATEGARTSTTNGKHLQDQDSSSTNLFESCKESPTADKAEEGNPLTTLLKSIEFYASQVIIGVSGTRELENPPSTEVDSHPPHVEEAPLVRKASKKFDLHEADFYGIDFALENSIKTKVDEVKSELAVTSINTMDFKRDKDISSEIQQTIANNGIQLNKKEGTSEMKQEIEEERAKAIALKKPKRAIDNVDYSEIFDLERLENECGLFSWRIENLTPVLQDEPNLYCPKDCYLILFSGEEKLPQIWAWIGKDAEMDKRFCCALFAVALRDSLEAECRIIRIEQTRDDEQDDEDEVYLKSVLNDCISISSLI